MLLHSGIGTVLRQILLRLPDLRPEWRWHLLLPKEGAGLPPHPSITLHYSNAPIYSLVEQRVLHRFIREVRPDVFWSPHYNVPVLCPARLLVTLHDLAHLQLPEYRSHLARRLYAEFMHRRAVAQAKAIVCVSQATADQVSSRFPAATGRITAVPNGVSPEWFDIPPAGGRHDPYLLFVGSLKPHKNLKLLLQAFASILEKVPHRLVLAGRMDGLRTGDPDSVRMAATLGDRVELTGLIPDEALRSLVAGADALILPSLYEGFGLPALEAMAAGTPVVASSIPALREVCAGAALYADPLSSESLARALLQACTLSPEERRTQTVAGLAQARLFTWEAAAKAYGEILDRLVSPPRAT